jgi:UDP-N-acetylmuramoylalanine--D-glutamate ligase
MRIQELDGKTVLVLGYGKEGRATVRALEAFAPNAHITIADKNADVAEKDAKHRWQLGDGWLEHLGTFDAIIKSPGIPPNAELAKHAEKTVGAVQVFLDTIRDSGAIVVGVTGSKGKSTTSSLLAAMLKKGGMDAHLVGNIGDPSIGHVADAKKGTVFVHEMSSYMLEHMTVSPHIAVVTSFFPEHLDYHGSVEAYLEAKKRIARFQTEDDATYFNADSPGAVSIASEGHARKIPVDATDCPLDLAETKLIGEHNRENVALAWKVAENLGVRKADAVAAAKEFSPLPHRLQDLGDAHGLRWIDDAISTTPESAVAALDALGDGVKTVILGGQDRGNDFTVLADRLNDSNVSTAILFPGSGPRIRTEIEATGATIELIDAPSMDDAVRIAKQKTPAGGIVLLSTASPSYGMFKNFEEKGEAFAKCIAKA